VREQLKEIEQQRLRKLKTATPAAKGRHAMIHLIARVMGIGIETADMYFAHELETDTFDIQSIKDRCKNFMLVDRHVGPVPTASAKDGQPQLAANTPDPYSGLPDYKEKLADARFRYMMTAQLFSYRLGEGAANPGRSLPLI
jgi:hypothetical protein